MYYLFFFFFERKSVLSLELEVALGLSDIENKHGSHCDESPLKLGT